MTAFVPALPWATYDDRKPRASFCGTRLARHAGAACGPAVLGGPRSTMRAEGPDGELKAGAGTARGSAEEVRQRAVKEMVEVFFEENENSKYQQNLAGVVELGWRNFRVELRELLLAGLQRLGLLELDRYTPPGCLGLTLDNRAVHARERARERRGAGVRTSRPVRVVYDVMCWALDIGFADRPIERFWFLETVARMPYFSYLSALHFLSTLGWWRSAQLRNVHHAEELNEHFHLMIMESLGGDRRWLDRFLAYHASIVYYWILVFLYFASPAESYAFSELLEAHAVDTYSVFLEENEKQLKKLPVPEVALEYYRDYEYYFDEFQTQRPRGSRRPALNSLYDVFSSICDDEQEHVRTMAACRDYLRVGRLVRKPGEGNSVNISGSSRTGTRIAGDKRRQYWKKWTDELAVSDPQEKDSEEM